jgi:phage terminase large subunit GpA-like protein
VRDAAAYDGEQRRWLARRIEEEIPSVVHALRPTEWAEAKRYLPPHVTPMPGPYKFDVAPHLCEILDCLSVDSPIREVSVMKGAQLCLTVGVLENFIGYGIDHVRTAPMMLVTADAELAKLRMESYVTPMLQASNLTHLIKSADEKNTRKTGKTDKKIEWEGGGFLVPFGAQNANKLRSLSIQFLLNDEIDGWPLVVGRDGDPMRLVRDRTSAYETSRKILNISTPTIKGSSKIEKAFQLGDQRYYNVCCLNCGHPQVLRWHRVSEAGEVSGIVWTYEKSGRLRSGSVRYLCEKCFHPHSNDDKQRLLSPDAGAQWVATAPDTAAPHHRSYHLSGLYSPVGMRTWEACVEMYLEAWDPERNKPRDFGKLQVFYNNDLGATFEIKGEKVRFEAVSPHRRHWYRFGEIPNKTIVQHCGSPVLLLTCAVDVHKDNLAVAVFGWCRDKRVVLVDYWRLTGDTEQLDDPGTWGALRKLIEESDYKADDGKVYRIQLTLVDSGYRTDHVLQFCADYDAGVFPVKGREEAPKGATIREFSEFKTGSGTAYGVTVDMYKDRWSAALRRSWDGVGVQPAGHFNAPIDTTDAQLKELTVETKSEKIDRATNERVGWQWRRPGGAANELWDLLVYNSAALDIICLSVCRIDLGLDFQNWPAFWDHCEEGPFFIAA